MNSSVSSFTFPTMAATSSSSSSTASIRSTIKYRDFGLDENEGGIGTIVEAAVKKARNSAEGRNRKRQILRKSKSSSSLDRGEGAVRQAEEDGRVVAVQCDEEVQQLPQQNILLDTQVPKTPQANTPTNPMDASSLMRIGYVYNYDTYGAVSSSTAASTVAVLLSQSSQQESASNSNYEMASLMHNHLTMNQHNCANETPSHSLTVRGVSRESGGTPAGLNSQGHSESRGNYVPPTNLSLLQPLQQEQIQLERRHQYYHNVNHEMALARQRAGLDTPVHLVLTKEDESSPASGQNQQKRTLQQNQSLQQQSLVGKDNSSSSSKMDRRFEHEISTQTRDSGQSRQQLVGTSQTRRVVALPRMSELLASLGDGKKRQQRNEEKS